MKFIFVDKKVYILGAKKLLVNIPSSVLWGIINQLEVGLWSLQNKTQWIDRWISTWTMGRNLIATQGDEVLRLSQANAKCNKTESFFWAPVNTVEHRLLPIQELINEGYN